MKKLFITAVLVIILQAGAYLYLDQVLLVPSADYTQQSVTTGTRLIKNQKISTDNKYYIDVQTTKVGFFTADNRLVKAIPLHTGESVTYCSWVPNTDLALVGINSNTSRGSSVTLKPVNLETGSHPVEPRIKGLPRGAKITNVAFSTQTNVTYMMVKTKYGTSVYRTDANNHVRRVINNASIGRIAIMQSEDRLLYDNEKGVVYSLRNSGRRVRISPEDDKYALIGTDQNDNIYLARLSSPGVVNSVLKGSINGDFQEHKILDNPYPLASVTIDYDGKLRLT